MPWSRNGDLPATVRNPLPPAAQTIWRKAANAALDRGLSDESAARIAWAAVKRAYKQNGNGEWVRKAAQVGYCEQCDRDVYLEKHKDLVCPVCLSPLVPKATKSLLDLASQPEWIFPILQKELERNKKTAELADKSTGQMFTINEARELAKIDKLTPTAVTLPVEIATDEAHEDVTAGYQAVVKNEEKRYTLGPVYAPGETDAHGETILADELQHAMWDYVRKGDRTVHLQHSDKRAGEWVEILTWPLSLRTTLKMSNNRKEDVEFPPGTVFMGVIWDEETWPLVKAGKISGYSLGGTAVKVPEKSPEEE